MDVIWCNRMLKMGYRLLSPQKTSGFDPFESLQVLHRWFWWSFPFSQQGGAPEKLCLLVYNPSNYRYITYINHSYWSYVHQLNVIERGHHLEWSDGSDAERKTWFKPTKSCSKPHEPHRWVKGPWGRTAKSFARQRLVTLFAQIDPNGDIYIYTGWWFQPLWKILVSWDYYSQCKEK